MPLVNFWKKSASFPSIFARISKFEHFRGDWAYAEPNLFKEISKKLFFQNVHLGPIRWVPKRFFKILIFYSQNLHYNLGFLSVFKNYSMRMLSIQKETILSHTEHMRKRFHRTLSIRRLNFRVCSASGKMLTVFTCTAMLSIWGNDFIAPWAYEEII